MDHPMNEMLLGMGFDQTIIQQAITNIGSPASDNIDNILTEIEKLQDQPAQTEDDSAKNDDPKNEATESSKTEDKQEPEMTLLQKREQELKAAKLRQAELKRKNAEIEAKATEARRLEKEKEEARQMELNRRKQGQKMGEDRKIFDDQEARKLQDKIRMERQADKDARNKIKQQLAADKERRRLEREAEIRARKGLTEPNPASAPNSSSSTAVPVVKKPTPGSNAAQTRIQIRLPDGSRLQQTFGSSETLAAVRVYIEVNKAELINEDKEFKLSLSFPRKTFNASHMQMSLSELDMVPSACVMVEVVNI